MSDARARSREKTNRISVDQWLAAHFLSQWVLFARAMAAVENHMKTGGEQTECQKRVVASRVDESCAEVSSVTKLI